MLFQKEKSLRACQDSMFLTRLAGLHMYLDFDSFGLQKGAGTETVTSV